MLKPIDIVAAVDGTVVRATVRHFPLADQSGRGSNGRTGQRGRNRIGGCASHLNQLLLESVYVLLHGRALVDLVLLLLLAEDGTGVVARRRTLLYGLKEELLALVEFKQHLKIVAEVRV